MWHACTLPSFQMPFWDLSWLWVVFWYGCQRGIVAHKFWGNPLDLAVGMWLVLWVKSAALEIFQRRTGGKSGRDWVDGRELWIRSKWYLSHGCANMPIVMRDHEWCVESPCRVKTLEALKCSVFTLEELNNTFWWGFCHIHFLFLFFSPLWWLSPLGRYWWLLLQDAARV